MLTQSITQHWIAISPLRGFGVGVVFMLLAANCLAQEFLITQVSNNAQGQPVIRHQADPAFYYILYRGTNVSHIVSAVDMALGVPVEGELADDSAPPSVAFYRVRQVSVVSPLDTDGDGIDDVWELRFRLPKAALNPHDANEDHTGSGFPDLQDYQLPVAYFLQASNTVFAAYSNLLTVTVHFSKPFTNAATAILLLGGTMVHQEDYYISGFASSNQTARVAVAGQTATFTITQLDSPSIEPDRYLTLSILEPANNAPTRYRTSQQTIATHVIRITEGDLGLYAGTMELTNGLGSTVHPVRLALKSNGGNSAIGYLDLTQSPQFQRGFHLPTTISALGIPETFPTPLVHQTNVSVLQKTLTWTLELGPVSLTTNETYEAAASASLVGLSTSGKSVNSAGRLQLVRLNP